MHTWRIETQLPDLLSLYSCVSYPWLIATFPAKAGDTPKIEFAARCTAKILPFIWWVTVTNRQWQVTQTAVEYLRLIDFAGCQVLLPSFTARRFHLGLGSTICEHGEGPSPPPTATRHIVTSCGDCTLQTATAIPVIHYISPVIILCLHTS